MPKMSSALVRPASVLQVRRMKPQPLAQAEGKRATAEVSAALLAEAPGTGARRHSSQLILRAGEDRERT